MTSHPGLTTNYQYVCTGMDETTKLVKFHQVEISDELKFVIITGKNFKQSSKLRQSHFTFRNVT